MTDTNTSKPWSRRRVLATAASGIALAAAGGFPMPAIAQTRKLVYWGGLIFSDDANKLLSDTIMAWGADNGVETEVVMINQNETTQKVSAAVASNTMPDALDVGLDLLLLLSRQDVFSTIDDLYKKVGDAHGGWYEGTARATDTSRRGGRAHWPPLRRQRQPAAAPQGPARARRLHRGAQDLGRARRAGGRGQQVAGLRAGAGALQCRRRERADQRDAVLWRPHRRRRRQEGHHQVRRDPGLSRLAQGRLGQGHLPARQHHLGRRRRQPGLSLWAGRLHRQYRLGRHRRQEGRSGAVRGQRLLAAARRPQGHDLADHPAVARHHQGERRCRTRPRPCSSTSRTPSS